MSTVRLRYTGHETTFTEHGIGAVTRGAEFDVPRGEEERYLRRSDVERAGDAGKPGGGNGKPSGSKRGTGPSTQDAQD